MLLGISLVVAIVFLFIAGSGFRSVLAEGAQPEDGDFLFVLMAVAGGAFLIAGFSAESGLLISAALVCMVLGMIVRDRLHRCPLCRNLLPKHWSVLRPVPCHACGWLKGVDYRVRDEEDEDCG